MLKILLELVTLIYYLFSLVEKCISYIRQHGGIKKSPSADASKQTDGHSDDSK